MDMKKFLQAVDGASSKKPAEGSNEMKQFLRVVKEADLNQPAEPPMPGQNMPPAQVNLDHIDAKTLDSAEGFKAAMKQAATEAGVESETAQMVDKLVAAAPDGTVDVEKTFVKMAAMFGDSLGELVKMIQDLALSYKKGMDSPEFQQFDDETKQSVKAAFAELTAMIPKIVADAKKMSADAKGMQAQTAPAPQATNEQTGMSRFLSIVTEGKGPLNRLTQAESIAVNQYTGVKKTITSPVLNVAKDAKPSMIGKYFKAVEQEIAEAKERTKDRAEQLAEIVSKKIMERVTIGPDGQVTGGFKPAAPDPTATAPSKAEPTEPPATIPGASLPRVDSADREKQTVTIDGQEYPMVHLPPDSTIRPRGGKKYAIPLAMLGIRSIGNLVGILVGDKVIVLPKGQQ